MKKILVLGGSYLQSDLVQEAIILGYDVISIDRNKECYVSKLLPGNFKCVDFSNKSDLINFLQNNYFDAVVSPANEYGNLVAADLAPLFGYRYNSIGAVKNSIDKLLLRDRLQAVNISVAKSFHVDTLEGVVFPVIVKPSNSSGGRGVSLAYSIDEVYKAIKEAELFLREGGKILIEEFIQGEQFSIETITFNGQHYIAGITKEITSGVPLFIERSHFTNFEIFLMKDRFENLVKKLLDTLSVKVGACHLEVLLKGDDIYVIDFATRSGGWRSKLLKYSNSANYNKLIIDSYLGNSLDFQDLKPPQNTATVGILMYPKDLNIYLKAKKEKALKEEYFYAKGPEVTPKNLLDSYGYFYAAHESTELKYNLES